MSSDSYINLNRVVVGGLLIAILIGCGGGGSGGAQSSDTVKFRAMQNVYQQFLTEHNGQPPKDEKQFRDFVGTKGDQLQAAGLTADEVFVSPRNGAPLRWIYGAASAAGQPGGSGNFGYEAEPVDGMRLVISNRGSTLMDETQFRQAVPNAP